MKHGTGLCERPAGAAERGHEVGAPRCRATGQGRDPARQARPDLAAAGPRRTGLEDPRPASVVTVGEMRCGCRVHPGFVHRHRRIARESAAKPLPDNSPRSGLKAPFAVGTQWQAPSRVHLLTWRDESPRANRHLDPSIPMNHQIEALNESVDTPAGGRAMSRTTRKGSCAEIGLGRSARSGAALAAFPAGARFTLALTSWQ